jgi:hypothetical protein
VNTEQILSYTNRGVVVGSTYIISDLHIGYFDEIPSMTQQDERVEIARRITSALERVDIDTVILNGDIFHEFKRPSDEAKEIFDELKIRLQADSINVIVIEGNHDKTAKQEFSSMIDFRQSYRFSSDGFDIVVTHGHKTVETKDCDLIILGHLHPVMKVSGKNWPAYLFGDDVYNDTDILILPCYNEYQDGVVISRRTKLDIDFPYVSSSDFKLFTPIIYDVDKDDVKKFPILRKSGSYFGM